LFRFFISPLIHNNSFISSSIRFQNTRFLVDRLHYRKGHVGCSTGYSMDAYTADSKIVQINSQANEQANASLRRLATQLTYMSPANVITHTSVFLALRNMDKMLWGVVRYWSVHIYTIQFKSLYFFLFGG
jgi:hypothetical protein